MALYPNSTSDRMEPLDDPKPSPREWMLQCVHCCACESTYRGLMRDPNPNWEQVAKRLGCDDCEEFQV